jgi:hypothetical protein
MAMENRTPGMGNAFLAWDTAIGAGEVRVVGGVITGRYLYGKATGLGLTVVVEYVFGTE